MWAIKVKIALDIVKLCLYNENKGTNLEVTL